MVNKKEISKEELSKEYLGNCKSLNEVAATFHVSYNTLRQRLIEYKIPIRKFSEQHKLNYKRGIGRGNFLPINIENNPKFFYIIGAIQGDGHLNKSQQQIQINVKDIDFLEFLKSILNELIPEWNIKIIKHTDTVGKVAGQWRINMCSRDFYRKFNTFIPKSLDEKCWFLKGMFDAEGSVILRWDKGNMQSITYSNTHKKSYLHIKRKVTLSQKAISKLKLWSSWLSELNIENRIKERPDSRSYISIDKTNAILRFNNLIGFRIKRKQARLENVIKLLGKAQVNESEKEMIIRLYKETGIGAQIIGKMFGRSKGTILKDLNRWDIITNKNIRTIYQTDIDMAQKICNKNLDFLKKYLPYSEDDMIIYLKELFKKLGRNPTTLDIARDKSGPSVSTFLHKFNSINNALKKAGLEANRNFYSDEELLNFIKNFYKKFNRVPEMREMKKNGYPHYSIYFNRFKTWNRAIGLSGLKPKKIVLYTKDDLKKILNVWIAKNNREPKQIDFIREKISPNPKVFIKNFGSWKNAISESRILYSYAPPSSS